MSDYAKLGRFDKRKMIRTRTESGGLAAPLSIENIALVTLACIIKVGKFVVPITKWRFRAYWLILPLNCKFAHLESHTSIVCLES